MMKSSIVPLASRSKIQIVNVSFWVFFASWTCTSEAFLPTIPRTRTHHPVTATTSASVTASVAASAVNGDSTPVVDRDHNPLDQIRLNVFEKARTVTSVCTSGTLCTVSFHEGIQGAPFGSFVDYVLDDQGCPVLLMNDMSMHTINIQKANEQAGEPAMVTLFTQTQSSTLQDTSRCSLTGRLLRMDANTASTDEMDAIRMRYSLAHSYADQVMDSPKFAFYRLVPDKIYFVGGFGVLAKWVDPQDYMLAAPDILATEAADIVRRINREHDEDLELTAVHLLQVEAELLEQVRLTNVDRLGMDVRVTRQKGTRRNKLQTDEFRIGFRIPVISVEDAKSEILKVFQEAWEKGNGFYEDGVVPGADVPIAKIAADSLE